MGSRSHDTERLALVAVGAIWVGLTLPVYLRLSAKLTEQGFELAWYQHVGLFAFAAVIPAVSLVALCLVLAGVCWTVVGARRLARRLRSSSTRETQPDPQAPHLSRLTDGRVSVRDMPAAKSIVQVREKRNG